MLCISFSAQKTGKKIASLVVVLAMLLPVFAFGSGRTAFAAGDFTVESGVLTRYDGSAVNVTVPSTVKKIGASAFYGKPIQSVTLPSSVTVIGESAFQYCEKLTDVKMTNSVTKIEAYAFYGCHSLRNVNLSTALQSIGNFAFWQCEKMGGVTVPKTCVFPFYSFSGPVTVAAGHPDYVSQNGILFNKDKTRLLHYPCNATATSYTVPSSVTIVEGTSFEYCAYLKKVTLPGGLQVVGDVAFAHCSALEQINIPPTVWSIGSGAFCHCPKLGPVSIPKSVTDIGTDQVFSCAVTVAADNQNYAAKDGILFDKSFTRLLNYPANKGTVQYTVPGTVTAVEHYAFENCATLQSITLPASVTKIGGSCFSNCTSLKTVSFTKNVKEIGQYAFYNCDALQNVNYNGSLSDWNQLKANLDTTNRPLTDAPHIVCSADSKPVSAVTVKKLPTKRTYVAGETFNPAGMVLKITYSDSTTAEVSSGYTYTPTAKFVTVGQQKMVVTYGGKSTGFYVTVNAPSKTVKTVTIKKLPTKRTYTVGQKFEPTGMILKVTYNDGTVAELSGGYTYTPTGTLNTAGEQKIVVSYGGKATGFYVTVNAAPKTVKTVTVKKLPAKRTYVAGETFNPAGMVLKITYSDSTTAEVSSGYTYTPTEKFVTVGQQKMVVSYGGKATGFYVTVNAPSKTVKTVTIKKLPTKRTYTVGQKFDPTGMILKVTYTDSTVAELSGGYTYTPTGNLNTTGQQKIVVIYGGKATGFYVTVN